MLTIISWNILFKNFNYQWRISEICKEISLHDPEIICLQEVIPEFVDIIKSNFGDKYESAYKHPFLNNTSDRCYGEMILSKIPIINRGFFKLTSTQGRVNTWIDIKHNDEVIRINTAHLESFREDKYKEIRQLQISHIEKENNVKKWLWIGDSNMKNDEQNSMYKPSNAEDSKGTYHHNRYLEYRGFYSLEYDKVWLNNIDICSYNTIGNKTVDKKWLSDHDGLKIVIN